MKIRSTSFFRGALTAGALGFALMVGCHAQGEGERCSLLNGNHDCTGYETNQLVCTAASNLQADDGVNRCCPEGNAPITDERCKPRIGGGSGTGGSTGLGGSTGEGGEGGEDSGIGSQCQYNSDCLDGLGLVCGPGGVCQHECQDDIDCADGLVCNSEKNCVASAP